MAHFTIDEVLQAAASASGTAFIGGEQGRRILESRVDGLFASMASEAAAAPQHSFDIFLSHSFQDKAVVAGIYKLLINSGFTVYVDWINDPTLNRSNVTSGNAIMLRLRMRQCNSLLYVTTANHSASKWMPWECGYFDGYDSKIVEYSVQPGHVAILPVLISPHSSFAGQEYLGMYPTAQKGSHARRNLNIHNQQSPTLLKHFDAWVANGHP